MGVLARAAAALASAAVVAAVVVEVAAAAACVGAAAAAVVEVAAAAACVDAAAVAVVRVGRRMPVVIVPQGVDGMLYARLRGCRRRLGGFRLVLPRVALYGLRILGMRTLGSLRVTFSAG